MRIDNLNQIGNIPFAATAEPVLKPSDEKNSIFDDALNAAIGIFNETNEYQKLADKAQLDFVTGKNDNMLSVMLAQEKAYASLNFTVQVTNKIVEAYKEIMRLQL